MPLSPSIRAPLWRRVIDAWPGLVAVAAMLVAAGGAAVRYAEAPSVLAAQADTLAAHRARMGALEGELDDVRASVAALQEQVEMGLCLDLAERTRVNWRACYVEGERARILSRP